MVISARGVVDLGWAGVLTTLPRLVEIRFRNAERLGEGGRPRPWHLEGAAHRDAERIAIAPSTRAAWQ